MNNESILDALIAIRRSQNRTQQEIAEKVGVSRITVVGWESPKDKREPSISQAEKYAEAVGCKLIITFNHDQE